MKSSKLTSKYQATIPKDIRKLLHLKPGDAITFQIGEDNAVIIRKTKSFDEAYLQALTNTLSEWESEYDEEDYKHLQNI